MSTDQIHAGFHRFFARQLPADQEQALFTAARAAGYQHMCSRGMCPKGLNHG